MVSVHQYHFSKTVLSFIRHDVTAEAGYDTIHQPTVWGIIARSLNVLAHKMQPCISTTFLFSDLIMVSHLSFGAGASDARITNIWVPARFLQE
jgi:hypothetical protein